MSSFIPTPQHEAIFAATRSGDTNIIISAVAGSGKTTTLIELLKVLPVSDPASLTPAAVLFLAFNKSIAEELQRRVPRHVQCSTFHSLGFRALKRVLPQNGRNVKVDGRKVSRLVWDAIGSTSPDANAVIKLVSLLKSQAPKGHTAAAEDFVLSLADLYDVTLEEREEGVRLALKVLEQSNANLEMVDFDDMLYLPVLLNAPFDKQDWILVDESQDTNEIQLEILSRLHHSATRSVFVGDPNQLPAMVAIVCVETVPILLGAEALARTL